MNEDDWLRPTDDAIAICKKLNFQLDKASERKFQLFRFACCRQIWQLLHEDYRQALESAERWLEGQSTRGLIEAALVLAEKRLSAVRDNWPRTPHRTSEIMSATVAIHVAKADYEWWSFPNTASYACGVSREAASAACWAAATDVCFSSDPSSPSPEWASVYTRVQLEHINLQGIILLDVFGNPFRSPAIGTSCLTSEVMGLSREIVEERTFDRLPQLADSLERAGCTNRAIMDHCRGPGPHVCGCWVLDVILGKE